MEAAGDIYSRELAFGAHRVGFSRHWSEELQRLRTGLASLEAQRAAAAGPPKHAPAAQPDVSASRVADRRRPDVRLDPAGTALPGVDLRIAAHAQDPSGIKSLRLRYRHVTQFEDYESAEMTLDAKTGAYLASIPGAFITPKWDLMYFVEALGNAGNGRNYPDLDRETPYVIVGVQRENTTRQR